MSKQIKSAVKSANKMYQAAKNFTDACAEADGFAFAYLGQEASSTTKRAREASELAKGLALDARYACQAKAEKLLAKKGE